jgi:hypothetical protein
MAKPYYFQTEDEKRMAAIRANPSGRPTQSVRPYYPTDAGPSGMEPVRPMRAMNLNAAKPNYDPLLMTPAEIEEKEKSEREQESYRIEQQYGSDKGGAGMIKRVRSVTGLPELPPDQAEMSGIYTPSNVIENYAGPSTQGGVPKWQQDLTKKFPGIGVKGSTANQYFTTGFKPTMSKAEVDELAERSVGDYSSSPKPDNTPQLTPLIPKGTRWGTSLDDLPGGRRTPQPFSQPMGMGTLSERPILTAPGSSERFAARRAIRMNSKSPQPNNTPQPTAPSASQLSAFRRAILMNPNSSEAARRWAQSTGGVLKNQSSNWAP